MQQDELTARALIESLADVILVLDSDGKIQWASPSVRRYGLKPEDCIGRRAVEQFHSGDDARFAAGLASAIANPGQAVRLDSLALMTADGGARYAEDTLTFRPDTPGINGVVVVIHEITPRERSAAPDRYDATLTLEPAKRAVDESEEQLRQVVRLSHIGIFDHNHITGEVYWSPEQRKIYGWGLDEPVVFSHTSGPGWRTWNLIHPDDRERVSAALRRAHQGECGGIFDLEYRVILRDGSTRWLMTRAQTFFAGEGPARRPVRTVGAVQDITPHKLAERQLQLMQTSVDKCSTAIYWVNSSGQVSYANDRACQSLGRTREELVGLGVWDFDPDFTYSAWAAAWEQAKQDKSVAGETRHRRKDGTVFPVDAVGSYLRIDGEELVFVFAQDATERHRAERELRLMHAAIHKSHTPFYAISPRGEIVYANEHACLMLQLTHDELIGRHTWDIDPEFPPQAQEAFWDDLKRAGMLRLEANHRRRDGVLIPVEVTADFFSFKDEEFALAFAQDITGRKKAELALRQNEERLKQVVLVYDIGIFEQDHVTGALYWSPELRKYWGVGPDDPVPLADFVRSIHPEDFERMAKGVERANDPNGDGRYREQHRIVRGDGSIRWLDTRSQTFFEGEGDLRRPVRTVGALVDITERRRLDEALRASERRLREAQSIAHIGNWELDLKANRLIWSDEIFRLFDVDPSRFEASYEAFLNRVHPDDRERVNSVYLESLKNRSSYRITHRILLSDGGVRHLEERCETAFAPDGTALLSRGTVQDVTSRVIAEEALRDSLREKETLLREVHHRVKNNLQIISSLLHFQAKRVKNADDLAAFADGRNRLRSMILVHERLYQSSDLSRIDFANYLQALVRDLQRSFSDTGRNVEVRVTADTLALPIESALPCGMILCELLTNVFKYAFPDGRPGTADVSLSAQDGRVRLSVRDDGVGLPAGFDPDHSTSFGWQLIRNLTAQLGGVTSVARSGGTQVTIDFASAQARP